MKFDSNDVKLSNRTQRTYYFGGLIAVDAKGNLAMPINTVGMYRSSKTSDAKVFVAIYE